MRGRDHLASLAIVGQVTIETLLESWQRSLVALRRSPNTLRAYHLAVSSFDRWLYERGHSGVAQAVTRQDVEMFIGERLAPMAPTTIRQRVAVLKIFFAWCVEEGEIPASPLERIKTPAAVKAPTDVLSEETIKRLLKACEGAGFLARRDMALVRLLLATGMRHNELVRLTLADVDLRELAVRSVLKGGRGHVFAIGRKTALALDRYLRARMRHPQAVLDALWLTQRGPLSYSGLTHILNRIAADAGVGHIWPHLFRHTFAHQWLAEGGSEQGLMHSVGWRSRAMLDHYGRSVADQRARDEYQRLQPGDQF